MKLDVIKLAKEAGDAKLDPLGLGGLDVQWLERFASLVEAECRKQEVVTMELAHSILLWIQEGEALMEKQGFGVAFKVGVWWADRPWRKHSA